MSRFSVWTGRDARLKAERAMNEDLASSRAERAEFRASEDRANAKKTAEQQRINSKSAQSARNSLRRPGFLDSGSEGVSDVLG